MDGTQKEDTGKSMNILRYAKSTSRAEAALKSENIKPIALSYTCLKASGSHLVSQLKILLNNFLVWLLGDIIFWATPTPLSSLLRLWTTIVFVIVGK